MTFKIRVKINDVPDDRVLVCTEKMKEGANLQVTDLMIFYDQPMSIRQREQRIGRIKRMQSTHPEVTLVSVSMGLDYAIKKNLGLKYETASGIGYEDADEVSIQSMLKSIKQDRDWKKKEREKTILDFI